jgi:predicted small metal-binding protein
MDEVRCDCGEAVHGTGEDEVVRALIVHALARHDVRLSVEYAASVVRSRRTDRPRPDTA